MSENTAEFARLIIAKGQSQLETLVGRQWPDITRIMEQEGEIALSFKVSITDREAEEGTHAEKDNRIRTTLSFSEKFSDTVESALDPHPELPGLGDDPVIVGDEFGQKPQSEERQHGDAEPLAEKKTRKQRTPRVQNAEATTPLDALLNEAAAGMPLPRVKVELPQGDGEEIIRTFTEAAGAQGWPVACISLLTQAASEADTTESLRQVIAAHVEAPAPDIQEADPNLAQ